MADSSAEPCVVPADMETIYSIMLPYFIGWEVNVALAGFVCASFWRYFGSATYQRETRLVRITAWAVWLLSFTVGCMNFAQVFIWIIEPRRDYDTIQNNKILDCFAPIPGAMTGALVQLYLGRRSARCIANDRLKLVFKGVLWLLIPATFTLNVMFSVTNYWFMIGDLYARKNWNYNTSLMIFLWLVAFTDTLISVSLCLTLRSSISGFNERTDTLLRRLSMRSLQTGMLTAIASTTGAILCTIFPDFSMLSNLPMAFALPLTSLYALSLIVNLAAREPAQMRFSASTLNTMHAKSMTGGMTGVAVDLQHPGTLRVGLSNAGSKRSSFIPSQMQSMAAYASSDELPLGEHSLHLEEDSQQQEQEPRRDSAVPSVTFADFTTVQGDRRGSNLEPIHDREG